MSDTALDIVHQALQSMQERGVQPRASAAALENLSATAAKTPSPQTNAQGRIPAPATPVQIVPTTPPIAAVPTPKNIEFKKKSPDSSQSKSAQLDAIKGPILACMKCPNLVSSRTQVVFGVGNPDAEIMFVGEAPGADEDMVGEPFVGKAGQLLTKIIETMGLRRADVYIANVLKCRPDMPPGESGNRKPTPNEMATCKPYLIQQIEIIKPQVIVALGGTAVEGLLNIEKAGITKLRGNWREFHGIPVMPTYHPSYLLRNQALSEKRNIWEDMLAVLEKLGKPITEKQRGFFLPK
jgi:uracil-DNA glycosylase